MEWQAGGGGGVITGEEDNRKVVEKEWKWQAAWPKVSGQPRIANRRDVSVTW